MVAVGVVGGLDAAATLHTTAQLPHAVVTGDADAFLAIVTALLWRFALISLPIRCAVVVITKFIAVTWMHRLQTLLLARYMDTRSYCAAQGAAAVVVAHDPLSQPEQRIDKDTAQFLQYFRELVSGRLFKTLTAVPSAVVVLKSLGGFGAITVAAVVVTVYKVSDSFLHSAVRHETKRSAADGEWRNAWERIFTNANARDIAFMGSFPAERAYARGTLVRLARAMRARMLRGLPSKLWQGVFQVSGQPLAYLIIVAHMVLPTVAATVAAALPGLPWGGLLQQPSEAVQGSTAGERSYHVAVLVSSLTTVISAALAMIRTIAHMDVAFASSARIMSMWDGMHAWRHQNQQRWAEARGRRVHWGSTVRVQELSYAAPDGTLLLEDLSFRLPAGASLVITGPSGCGKTSLLRVLAGLWPALEGVITVPGGPAGMLFVPKEPYLVLGSLRQQVYYPCTKATSRRELTDELLEELLEQVGLLHLLDRCHPDDTTAIDWAASLSLGEAQRLAVARVLLHEPLCVAIDEGTSALDPAAEAAVYKSLAGVRGMTIISVAHRASVVDLHSHELCIDGAPGTSWRLRPVQQAAAAQSLLHAPVTNLAARTPRQSPPLPLPGKEAAAALSADNTTPHARRVRSLLRQVAPSLPWHRVAVGATYVCLVVAVAGAIMARLHVLNMFRQLFIASATPDGLGDTALHQLATWRKPLALLGLVTALRAAAKVLNQYMQAELRLAGMCRLALRWDELALTPWGLLTARRTIPDPAARMCEAGPKVVQLLTKWQARVVDIVVALLMWSAAFQGSATASDDDMEEEAPTPADDASTAAAPSSLMPLLLFVAFLAVLWLAQVAIEGWLHARTAPAAQRHTRHRAGLRTAVVRLRHHAEAIAFYNGDAAEHALIDARLQRVYRAAVTQCWADMADAWTQILFRDVRRLAASFMPGVMLLRGHSAGGMSDEGGEESVAAYGTAAWLQGSATQLVARFAKAHDLYHAYSTARPVVNRAYTFAVALKRHARAAERVHGEHYKAHARDGMEGDGEVELEVEEVSLSVPLTTRTLVNQLSLRLLHSPQRAGRLLLRGPSGSGKSTLLRALAGTWPVSEGRIVWRGAVKGHNLLFLPQQPHLPPGTLRDVLLYPRAHCGGAAQPQSKWGHNAWVGRRPDDCCWAGVLAVFPSLRATHTKRRDPVPPADSVLRSWMCRFGLGHLVAAAEGLDGPACSNWGERLSGGEAQRVAIVRLLAHAEAATAEAETQIVAVLDEATSALDGHSQAQVYETLVEAGIGFISVAHRPEVVPFHNQVVEM